MPSRAASKPTLILASGSAYRAEMLQRLGLEFITESAGIDERRCDGETPEALVRRLALEKARHVAARRPDAFVIGADQVAALGTDVLGKPGDRSAAIAQLDSMAGREVVFLSGIALLAPGIERIDCVPTTLRFRALTRAEIERYVDLDRPFDCAGAMRSERLGITLLESMASDDPTALIGLPLIRLAEWLREAGWKLP